MKLYRTSVFVNRDGDETSTLYYVFDDIDRLKIVITQSMLVLLKIGLDNLGKVQHWNNQDDVALNEILVWPFPYNRGGKNADLSSQQIAQVMKMCRKLGCRDMSFGEVFDIEPAHKYLTAVEMRIEQDKRREAAAKWNEFIKSQVVDK